MLLHELLAASTRLAATPARRAKTAIVAETLQAAAAEELEVVACYLAGRPRQRRTGVGWRGLADLPPPAEQPTLTVLEVDEALETLAATAGTGSQAVRRGAVQDLFGRATREEQPYLRDLLFENLRQGAQDSVLLDGIAAAADIPVAAVRRAAMFTPSSGEVARAALLHGRSALDAFALVPGRPIRPMLAGSAPDVAQAAERFGDGFLVDRKLDGIRVQVHRTPDGTRVFTRSLEDITDRLPEVVQAAARVQATTVVLDGEVIALDDQERPRPFQETAARTASTGDLARLREQTPLSVFVFDLLHVDGEDLVDAPGRQRLDRLARVVPPEVQVPRLVTASAAEAQRFFDDSVAAGHEGVVVKSLEAPYAAGRRGSGWLKVKPRHTLDLVVLAVEWGSGRRRGWLSTIHLGARDGDGFTPLGKTFKGMTDAMLTWQTERFLALETHREGHVVHLRPEQVVEIAFDGVQRSSRYPGGVALRFARVLRYRDDKSPAEADTLDTVRSFAGG